MALNPLTVEHFEQWWAHKSIGRPLMQLRAAKAADGSLMKVAPPADNRAIHMDGERILASYHNYFAQRSFLAEGYPAIDINIGPGSLAVYLGSTPVFAPDTVWYSECIDDPLSYPKLAYDAHNPYWVEHRQLLSRAVEFSGGRWMVNIPDIIENIDIYAAMRGPTNTCYDLIDLPGEVHRRIDEIDAVYFEYYDRCHDIVTRQGVSSYTAFAVMGKGRTAKVQCDFCALMSPGQFREFIVPSLTMQCRRLDHSVYHLDGKDCIKHLDALLDIEALQAVQWTAGAGQPDGGNSKWYPLYDKIKQAGKSMHVSIYDGGYDAWVGTADKFVQRYGAGGVYFLFPDMSLSQAEGLLLKAEREWSKSV